MSDERDSAFMRRALELAARGRGHVEPNPVVGCVIVSDQNHVVGEGWHQRYGGPHAEVEALRVAGDAARGARLYVTLEPCCHHGKTPPCTEAILAAGIRRVVAATRDPFPAVAGGGLRRLSEAGVDTSVGLLEAEARDLNAPYWKLTTQGQPWIIAKWAMTLDGKIATYTGDSRWISNAVSRRLVHQLRGESDAVLVGRGTVLADDPLLTARPPGPRVPLRIVLDSAASLPLSSQLVRTADQAPVLVVASVQADPAHESRLVESGCEVLRLEGASWPTRLPLLLAELGRRRMTRVLVEGGAVTLGGFFDAGAIDELHVFIAPKLCGGRDAPSPLAGCGTARIADAWPLDSVRIESLEGDIHIHGKVKPRGVAQTDRFPHPPAPQ